MMVKLIYLAIIFALNGCFGLEKISIKSDPDKFVKTPTLIRSKGYPAEEYNVTTKDGYILTVHRIPNYQAGPGQQMPVVFLQHGLLDETEHLPRG